MNSKLEMMFTDNKRTAQCRLTKLQSLTPIEILAQRLKVERELSKKMNPELKEAGRDWLQDISYENQSVQSLFEFSRAIGPEVGEWNHYQALLEQYCERYESYLNKKNQYEEFMSRTAPLELKMLNAGESIERDLWVEMKLPHKIEIYSEKDFPQAPLAPSLPEKPQAIYEKMLRGTLDLQQLSESRPVFKEENSIITDLKIQRHNSCDVTFRVKKLQQQGRVVVGKFYVVFPTIEAAKSFSIEYKVFTDKKHSVKEGTLSIKVIE